MTNSRDFLFEFRETRDRVMLRRKILTALQISLALCLVVAALWMVTR